jgi:hypothetical protein
LQREAGPVDVRVEIIDEEVVIYIFLTQASGFRIAVVKSDGIRWRNEECGIRFYAWIILARGVLAVWLSI